MAMSMRTAEVSPERRSGLERQRPRVPFGMNAIAGTHDDDSYAFAYRAVVCDLDGVVYRGPTPVPHAVEALASMDIPVIYATNNASRPPGAIALALRHLGVVTDDASIATSAQAAAWLLTTRCAPKARILVVGSASLSEEIESAGFVPVSPRDAGTEDVVAVVQGYSPSTTAADLAAASYAVQRGARWLATNTDATLPTEHGVAPGNGSFVAAVAAAVGRGPDLVAGKPESTLYEMCADRLRVPVPSMLAVGDRLDTDIKGAVAAGIDSCLVLTGVDTLDGVLRAPVSMRPRWVAPDLRWLKVALAAPAQRGASGLADLGQAIARVHAATDVGAADVEIARLGERAHEVCDRLSSR
jgi:glycerol-1-phosphatase